MTRPAHFFSAGYNANFSATSGNLSAQFGLHYLQFRQDKLDVVAHGLSTSATALFSLPIASRFDNGVPKAAIGFYAGLVPTGLVSGQLNFLTIPLAVGFGVPLSPASFITLTPWVEAAPSVNVDSDFSEINLEGIGRATLPDALPDLSTIDPNDPNAQQAALDSLSLSQDDVAQVLAEGVDVTVGFGLGIRIGLETAFHLSETFGITAYATYGTFADTLGGVGAFQIGGALVLRWDDIVPAVLPAARRLEGESCDDVETRFRTCPRYQELLHSRTKPLEKPAATPAPAAVPAAAGVPAAAAVPSSPPPAPTTAVPAPPAALPPVNPAPESLPPSVSPPAEPVPEPAPDPG